MVCCDGILSMLLGSCTHLSPRKVRKREGNAHQAGCTHLERWMLCLVSQVAGCWTHADLVLIPLFSEGVDVLHRTATRNVPDTSVCTYLLLTWAARYNTWLLIELTPKGVVFSLLLFFIPAASNCAFSQDGGCWINLGPLLFHWADAHTYLPEEELSIELSLEEVEAAAKQLGFKTIKREMVSAAYMTNLRYVLLCFTG